MRRNVGRRTISGRNHRKQWAQLPFDRAGHVAAATSNRRDDHKRYGRVGDSPIIGAGTYANNDSCAVSATGWGEFFIRQS